MKARKETNRSILRKSEVPKIELNARSYYEMIIWQDLNVTEPPITHSISDEELNNMVTTGEIGNIEFPKFPNHTQSVERTVKVVTEAAKTVCGELGRDGFIRNWLDSCRNMPQFLSKKDFCI